MGLAKKLLMEYEARGYGKVPNKYVCHHCFDEKGLSNFIKKNGKQGLCSYCGKKTDVLDLEIVIKHIISSISNEWQDPVENSPYESAEGGYLNNYQFDIWDLLSEQEPINAVSQTLFEDIYSTINTNLWARPFAEPFKEQHLLEEWDKFIYRVKHKLRFTIFSENNNNKYYPIEQVAKIISDLKFEQICNDKIYRIRITNNKQNLNSASEMGTVPIEYALQANRMSPVGIAMFYGAFDEQTAVDEVLNSNKNNCNIYIHTATFIASRPLNLISLPSKLEIPSIYDEVKGDKRPYYIFMQSFIDWFARPIDRDGKEEHLEYIPTQIITEYLRYNYTINNKPIDGIIYKSSVGSGKSVVLFIQNDQCVDNDWNIKKNFKDKLYLKMIKYK